MASAHDAFPVRCIEERGRRYRAAVDEVSELRRQRGGGLLGRPGSSSPGSPVRLAVFSVSFLSPLVVVVAFTAAAAALGRFQRIQPEGQQRNAPLRQRRQKQDSKKAQTSRVISDPQLASLALLVTLPRRPPPQPP